MASGLQKCLFTSINLTVSILCIRYFFPEKECVGFTKLSKGSMVQKNLRTPAIKFFANIMGLVDSDVIFLSRDSSNEEAKLRPCQKINGQHFFA